MDKPRLLLADDRALMLDAVRKLLEPEFEVIGTAGDGRAAVTAFEQASSRRHALINWEALSPPLYPILEIECYCGIQGSDWQPPVSAKVKAELPAARLDGATAIT